MNWFGKNAKNIGSLLVLFASLLGAASSTSTHSDTEGVAEQAESIGSDVRAMREELSSFRVELRNTNRAVDVLAVEVERLSIASKAVNRGP